MNAVVQNISGDIVDDVGQFFAPMASDLVDRLIGEFEGEKVRLEALASVMTDSDHAGVLHHFIEGNLADERHTIPHKIGELFKLDGAVANLTAAYWDRALKLTDVLDYMPQKRRAEWFEQIRTPLGRKKRSYDHDLRRSVEQWEIEPLPPFEEDTVRSTLHGLLNNRAQFFAERVDGIFRSLSRDHVTNQPQGFNKRMIMQGAITDYGSVGTHTSGVINDLRCVIARFMGRDEPSHNATDAVIKTARKHNGEWMGVDGNAFRIRVYNGVGTAHLEVHPDMAWRLNSVLSHLYPAAIPAEFRRKPVRRRKIKDFELQDRPLPFAVLAKLVSMDEACEKVDDDGPRGWAFRNIRNTRQFNFDAHRADKLVLAEAGQVLEAIGGVFVKRERGADYWQFSYEPQGVIDEIIRTGCIPDYRSHQFYPTPANVALRAVECADINQDHICLEPSAGTGGIADLMPEDRTVCVEISPLHCRILEAKGHKVAEADFLAWAAPRQFDRIVMNPPFSEGRWQAHVEHAAKMVASGGRLVAILPASARNKAAKLLPGMDLNWSEDIENAFPGTSVTVVILTATK